jgi:hypothetical protein
VPPEFACQLNMRIFIEGLTASAAFLSPEHTLKRKRQRSWDLWRFILEELAIRIFS